MSSNAKKLDDTENNVVSVAPAMLITCEHGGNRIPAPYRHLFRKSRAMLESHRGFDPGALVMSRALARHFSCPLLVSMTSRLLVDLNRSIGHQDLHADVVRELPGEVRQQIIGQYYQPYRDSVEECVARGIATRGILIHVSCHSFTNNLNGRVRHADIGLLYDPARGRESALCAHWKSALKAAAPHLTVRRNFPYEGRHDGLTSTLRKKFSATTYLGIELELNQKNILVPARNWIALRQLLINSLDASIERLRRDPGEDA